MPQHGDNKVEVDLRSTASPPTTSFVPSPSTLLPYSAATAIRQDLNHFANLFTSFGQRAAVDILTDQIMAGHQQGHYGHIPYQSDPRSQAGPSRSVPSGPPPYPPAPGAPTSNSVQAPSLPNPFWSPGSYDVAGYNAPSAPSHSPPLWDPSHSYPADPRSSSGVYGAAANQEAQNNIQTQMMFLQWQQQQLQMRAMALASGHDPQLHLPGGQQPPFLQQTNPHPGVGSTSPVDTQSGNTSGEGSDEKRRRNTEASARFRQKKKERVENLSHTLENLEQRANTLEKEATNLRTENSWLKEMVIMKGRRNLQAHGHSGPDREAASDGDDEQDE